MTGRALSDIAVQPLVAVELDDATHASEDRQAPDAFLKEAFEAACLPLQRVGCKVGYVALDFATLVRSEI